MKHKPMESAEVETPDEESSETPKFEEHEIEDFAHTLKKAERIKSDPHKMKHVHKHLANEKSMIDKINPKEGLDGLRRVAKKKLAEN